MPRKYRSHRDRGKYSRRHSRHRDRDRYSYSVSKSRTRSRHYRKDKYYYEDDRKHRRRDSRRDRHRYRRSSSSSSYERDRDRSSSGHFKNRSSRKHKHEKKKYSRRSYKSSSSSYVKKTSKHHTQVKKSTDDEKDRSKDADHFKYKEGYLIQEQYKIVKHLGDGTFGRVLEVEDLNTNRRYAMKVIRAVKRYVESAQTEKEILEDVNSKDPNDEMKIVRLEAAFFKDPSRPTKEQNYFMIFEKLGMSLYDFLKMNNYKGFSIENIQSFANQILISIGFMHNIGLTHTDLKPENILLVNDDHISVKGQHMGDRSSTSCSKSEETVYNKPLDTRIKIIDMGGATYDNEHHSSIINTRQYRAPEVMLACCQWGHESDVWSIGCILLELYSGDLFFETHETYEHLAMIDRACGPIPYWMGNRADSKLGKHFVLEEEYYNKYHTFFDFPKHSSGMQSTKRVQNMKLIDEVIPNCYPEFRDLLKKMLTIDPKERITCRAALEHPFFQVNYKES